MDFHALLNVVEHWPTDWIIIGALIVLISFEALRSGAGRAASLSLALPLSLFLYTYLAHTTVLESLFKQASSPLLQSVIFAALVMSAFVLTQRITASFGGMTGSLVQSLIAGTALTIILIIVWITMPVLQTLYVFGAQVQGIFGGGYSLWWLIACYIGIATARS